MLAVTINGRKLDRELKVASAAPGTGRSQALARETLVVRRSILSRLRLYLAVYFVAWSTPSFVRIMQMYDPEFESTTLSTLMCLLCPAMGLGNALVFAPDVLPVWRGHSTRDIWGSYRQVGFHYHSNAQTHRLPSLTIPLEAPVRPASPKPKSAVLPVGALSNPLAAYRSVQL
eukprot:gnl/Ergobibamus_cyprinoides/5178.p1 GENE.gnl/Ergobibamus_cyprinoides/5178~~gnl/Ergobibamus_cyprinoides/5178.p1  ORF type:complete len:173 (+),score=20.29 gnl/Ergobibamus_cyprinoides/5178:62-580(+)